MFIPTHAPCRSGLHIGKYVCGDEAEEPSVTRIDGQVDAVAAAIAEDFVVITSSCQAGGNAEVRAQAFAYVEARAEAVGVIVEDIFARSAEVCGRCPTAVSALSEAAQVLIAEAVAEAWTQVWLPDLPCICTAVLGTCVTLKPDSSCAVRRVLADPKHPTSILTIFISSCIACDAHGAL